MDNSNIVYKNVEDKVNSLNRAFSLIDKTTDSVPTVKSLLIHAIFHDPCDKNLVYSGIISCPRAQIDPSSVELNLTSDGKHAASYLLQKEYCSDESKLFTILVSED